MSEQRKSKNNSDKIMGKSGLKRMVLQLLWSIAIVAAFLVLFGRMSASINISSIENGISLIDPDGGVYEVIYVDIELIQLIELPEDYGACVDGETSKGFSYGLWQNDEWGTYSLCVKNSVEKAVFISQSGKALVFNYEGIASTESFYNAMLQAMSGEKEQSVVH